MHILQQYTLDCLQASPPLTNPLPAGDLYQVKTRNSGSPCDYAMRNRVKFMKMASLNQIGMRI